MSAPLIVKYIRTFHVHGSTHEENKEFGAVPEAIDYARWLLEGGSRATIFWLDREVKGSV